VQPHLPYVRTAADCESAAKKQFTETVRVETAMGKEASVPGPHGKFRNCTSTNTEWYECHAIPADPASVVYGIVECFAADTVPACGAAADVQSGSNPEEAASADR
jgi:hypothetical protein